MNEWIITRSGKSIQYAGVQINARTRCTGCGGGFDKGDAVVVGMEQGGLREQWHHRCRWAAASFLLA